MEGCDFVTAGVRERHRAVLLYELSDGMPTPGRQVERTQKGRKHAASDSREHLLRNGSPNIQLHLASSHAGAMVVGLLLYPIVILAG
jgi:hypothetical protein